MHVSENENESVEHHSKSMPIKLLRSWKLLLDQVLQTWYWAKVAQPGTDRYVDFLLNHQKGAQWTSFAHTIHIFVLVRFVAILNKRKPNGLSVHVSKINVGSSLRPRNTTSCGWFLARSPDSLLRESSCVWGLTEEVLEYSFCNY